MPTQLSSNRLAEIQGLVKTNPLLKPETGIATLPDSPGTGISSTGNIIDLNSGEVLGSLGGLPESSNASTTPSGLSNVNDIISQLKGMFGGVSTSVNLEQTIRDNIKKQEDAQRALIESQYSEKTAEQEEYNKAELGTAKAISTRLAGGLGLDTATAGYIASVQKQGEERINKLNKAKEQALATLDVESLKSINESLRKEEENQQKLNDALFDKAMKILGVGIDMEQLNLQKQQFENKETEIDTFTDANGDRIATFKNDKTGVTRQVNLGKVATQVKTSIVETDGHKWLINESTGEKIKDLGKITYAPKEAPTSYQEWQLAGGEKGTGKTYAQFLASGGGGSNLFSKEKIAQMEAGGLDVDTATDIYKLVSENTDLETIRDGLRKLGKDPRLLDVFDRVNQIYKILGQEKPE